MIARRAWNGPSWALLAISLSLVAAPALAQNADTSVAVLPLEAGAKVSANIAQSLTDTVVQEVLGSKRFDRVLGPKQVDERVGRSQREQLMRAANDPLSIVDDTLAGGLGVTHLLAGSLKLQGKDYKVSLRLIELRTAMDVSAVTETLVGKTASNLKDALRPVLRKMLIPEGSQPPAEPAPTVAAAEPDSGATPSEPAKNPEDDEPASLTYLRIPLLAIGGVLCAAAVFSALTGVGLGTFGLAMGVIPYPGHPLSLYLPAPTSNGEERGIFFLAVHFAGMGAGVVAGGVGLLLLLVAVLTAVGAALVGGESE